MADAPKTVRGTLVTSGSTVQVTEETAGLLGSEFEQEKSTKKAAASSSSSSKSNK
jgi:hypothetical protein